MNDKQNGPEWAPIRNYVKSFLITVVIYDKDDKEIRREEMDYGKPDDRAWLGRLSYWSWSNGHFVETFKKE